MRSRPNSCTSSAPNVDTPTSLTHTGRSVTARISSSFEGHSSICQWFHFEDHRLDDAVGWLKRLGVRHLRTGLSWADSLRPGADEWFDRQMDALADFDVTLTFCFTPECEGVEAHHTSPPRDPHVFADFCARMTRRYVAAPLAART